MKKFALIALCLLLAGPAFADNYRSGGYRLAGTQAKDVDTTTTNFNGSLSSADNTVQKALDTLDDASGGSGAPTDATYITQTANGDLSAEQALGSLSTGVVTVTTTTGVLGSVVPGTSGNVLTSNGTAWTSATPSAAGDITAVGGCTTGACFDGSTSSGTVLTFDHGTGTYGSDGTITFDGTNNKFTIKTSGITDTGSVYTPILALEPINTATNHPAWIQMDGLGSHDGTFRAGVDGNVVGFVAGRAGNSSGAGLSFYGTTVYPITITNNDGASPAISNGGVDLGSSSGRWNNVYSEAGNFSGAITAPGGIATTGAGTGDIGSVSNYFNGMWANAFWAYSGASWMKMTHSGSYCYFTTNDGPFYFSDSIILGASGETLNFTLTGDINLGSDLGGKLNVDGTKDERQLWIQGHSTQTNPLMLIEKSDGTDLVAVTNSGLLLTPITVSALGTATAGRVNMVSDAADATDCTTGSGSTYNLCIANGSAWIDA